ncbi:DNA 5'-adenosine monophosphate hydrolase [Sporobolomyces koalae]|uniref:DNA 5'-adenosine monophosphate hydrolase n=1 Tax=Sporobolomyces koalae TaxID=500713 RepID=UPI0031794D39
MSWSAVLESYARMKNPERELPERVMLTVNSQTLTIFDGFEKAKYHFLVLPRDPFRTSDGHVVQPSALHSLSTLLKSPDRLQVLRALARQALEVKEMIHDEMLKEYGFVWDVKIGFHAVESMKHVHLHVISSEMISDRLKNKKHWNSFHPDLGFFLHLEDVITQVEQGDFSLKSATQYESILKQDLRSIYPPYDTFKNLPQLKLHLVHEFEQMKTSSAGTLVDKDEARAEDARKRKEPVDKKLSPDPKKVKV